MELIKADEVLYIKLGQGGRWEEECLKQNQTLRLGYQQIPHDLCLQGKWSEVRQFIKKESNCGEGTATSHRNQIKSFYVSGEDVLWVTFYGNSLWWCFSKPEITLMNDGTKARPALNKWSCVDIHGGPLLTNNLSGKLLSMQGFQGTICKVSEANYLINKINGVEPKDLAEAREAAATFEQKLEAVIRRLHWKDFELLIDMIFRQAGWKRCSDVGSTIKTIDLDLISPITSERYGVQVKSQADLATFNSYQEARFKDMEGFTRFYFAVHTPSPDLEEASQRFESKDVRLLLPHDIARLSVAYGMAHWVMDKAQ